MHPVTLENLTERLELADQLLAGRDEMLNPQDLPGRYGRVVQAIDHLLQVMKGEAVLAGGWAVWRHGYVGRITQDIGIVLPAKQVEEFQRLASISGFDVFSVPTGQWPKLLRHKETGIQVSLLPEGSLPGTASHPAPEEIPHPEELGARPGILTYISLEGLVELKIGAGRARDEADIPMPSATISPG